MTDRIHQIKITQKGDKSLTCHLEIDGVRVGRGTRESLKALRDELRASQRKARLVRDLFLNHYAKISGRQV